jgi:asparagine synthetase B (glutamine-hydrolysing)
MCGIIGSPHKDAFYYLFDQNKERGNFAYGVIKFCINNNVKVIKENDFNKKIDFEEDIVFYLGHLQSPTSTQREFTKDTTHPFEYKGMYLAHNGVLSNFEHLKQKYGKYTGDTVNEVDSSIILPMVDKIGLKCTLEEIQGTFGCWLYDSNSSELFVFRSGSTLYTDGKNISSKPISEWKLLEEGVIYRFNFTKQKYEEIDRFNTSSGFFI